MKQVSAYPLIYEFSRSAYRDVASFLVRQSGSNQRTLCRARSAIPEIVATKRRCHSAIRSRARSWWMVPSQGMNWQ